jgi:hypothetical protein
MTRHLEYRDSDGNAVSADEALDDYGVLRSGFSLRVPVFLMDSTNSTALQRAIARHSHGRSAQNVTGLGGPAALRPSHHALASRFDGISLR